MARIRAGSNTISASAWNKMTQSSTRRTDGSMDTTSGGFACAGQTIPVRDWDVKALSDTKISVKLGELKVQGIRVPFDTSSPDYTDMYLVAGDYGLDESIYRVIDLTDKYTKLDPGIGSLTYNTVINLDNTRDIHIVVAPYNYTDNSIGTELTIGSPTYGVVWATNNDVQACTLDGVQEDPEQNADYQYHSKTSRTIATVRIFPNGMIKEIVQLHNGIIDLDCPVVDSMMPHNTINSFGSDRTPIFGEGSKQRFSSSLQISEENEAEDSKDLCLSLYDFNNAPQHDGSEEEEYIDSENMILLRNTEEEEPPMLRYRKLSDILKKTQIVTDVYYDTAYHELRMIKKWCWVAENLDPEDSSDVSSGSDDDYLITRAERCP
jgi:hypothetical protein